MLAIFYQTAPFFALIGVGYLAVRWGAFTSDAAVQLTKFVFYFALSAMIFGFASKLSFDELWDTQFVFAYLSACLLVYALLMAVALARKQDWATATIEAQCGIIGNVGFMGIPILILILGDAAAAPNMLVLSVDLIVFSSLTVISITAYRQGGLQISTLGAVLFSIFKNPMVMAIAAGILWGASGLTMPAPAERFVGLLGAAATPCALFVIGASLAEKSAERISTSLWLSFVKLFLFPSVVAIFALLIFDVDPFPAAVMIATAAMPTAGNIYILAQHFGVAPQRVSSTILISTIISIVTLTLVLNILITKVL